MIFFYKLAKSKILIFLTLCITVLLFSVRVINLDSDVVPWGTANYQPIDEGSYSILAINHQNYGTINPDESVSKYPFYTPSHVRTNIIGNLFSYIGLQIFGDNYYGLRIPYVFMGSVNFLVFALLLLEIRKQYGNKSIGELWMILGILLYLANDYIYLVASRVVEPSMVRLIFVQLVVYIFMKLKESYRLRFFLIGGFATISVFGVYITNVFLYLACLITLLYIWRDKGKKYFIQSFSSFISGCLLVYLLCEVYYITIWHTSGLINMFSAVFDFSSSRGYDGANTLKNLIKMFIRFFSANSLLYNLPVLFSAILALPACIAAFVKRKDITILFILAIPFSFLLQTMVSEDFIVRKFIIVYTLFICIAFIGFLCRSDFDDFVKDFSRKLANKAEYFKVKISEDAITKKWRLILINNFLKYQDKLVDIFYCTYIGITALLCLCSVIFRIFIVNDQTRADFTSADKIVVVLIGLCPVLLLALIMMLKLFLKDVKKSTIVKAVVLVCMCTFIVNGYYSLKYVYLAPTFSDKKLMIELGKIVGNKYVLGEYENGFTLYNDMRPVLDKYENLREHMEENKDLYYFDYDDNYDSGMRRFFDNVVFEGSEYTVIPIKRFDRDYQTFGKKRKMALYKVVPKHEAVQFYISYYDSLNEEEKKKQGPIYSHHYGNYVGNIDKDIYVNIYGNIYGDVNSDIFGDVYGDIYGDVIGKIYGNVKGKIYGEIK